MKLEEVPQDLKYYKDSVVRDLTYAVDEQGQYQAVVSDGWEPKNDALELALEEGGNNNDEISDSPSSVAQAKQPSSLRSVQLDISHRQAAHCENGTISSLLRYYNIDLSEPMVFGLASGLYFSHMPFVKLNGLPVTSFRTFPGVFFRRITKALGIKRKTRRFLSSEKAMDMLDRLLLQRQIPVGCVVGMYDLPYIPKEYRFRFNGHNICVVGKDEVMGDYTVLDSNATQKVTISRTDLAKVRFAKGGTYPLMGQMYWIESVPEHLPDMKPVILKAISKTCRNMTCYPKFVPYFGTNGILYLSRRIRKWGSTMSDHDARMNLAQVIRMLEEIGTGGAGFRFIYAAFLQESSNITGLKVLDDYSQRITKIGDMWREFAYKGSRIIKKRKGETYTFDDLGDLLYKIGVLENGFYKELNSVVKQYL